MCVRTIWESCTVDSRTSLPIPIVIWPATTCQHTAVSRSHDGDGDHNGLTGLTHILEQLHLRGQAFECLVVLALEVVREPLSLLEWVCGVRGAAAVRRGPPRGRRRVVFVRPQQRGAVVQRRCAVSASVWGGSVRSTLVKAYGGTNPSAMVVRII